MLNDFERLVMEMRLSQKAYFLARKKGQDPYELLVKSKALETLVDKQLVAKVNEVHTLFDAEKPG
jgi:hypothetical protein